MTLVARLLEGDVEVAHQLGSFCVRTQRLCRRSATRLSEHCVKAVEVVGEVRQGELVRVASDDLDDANAEEVRDDDDRWPHAGL